MGVHLHEVRSVLGPHRSDEREDSENADTCEVNGGREKEQQYLKPHLALIQYRGEEDSLSSSGC